MPADLQPVLTWPSVMISVVTKFAHLPRVRAAVSRFCEQAGLSRARTSLFVMAVDEACANVVEHGQPQVPAVQDAPLLSVRMHADEQAITVEILDQGPGFDFFGQPVITPDEYLRKGRARGLGMFIITRFADDINYERATPDGNRLRLVARL